MHFWTKQTVPDRVAGPAAGSGWEEVGCDGTERCNLVSFGSNDGGTFCGQTFHCSLSIGVAAEAHSLKSRIKQCNNGHNRKFNGGRVKWRKHPQTLFNWVVLLCSDGCETRPHWDQGSTHLRELQMWSTHAIIYPDAIILADASVARHLTLFWIFLIQRVWEGGVDYFHLTNMRSLANNVTKAIRSACHPDRGSWEMLNIAGMALGSIGAPVISGKVLEISAQQHCVELTLARYRWMRYMSMFKNISPGLIWNILPSLLLPNSLYNIWQGSRWGLDLIVNM